MSNPSTPDPPRAARGAPRSAVVTLSVERTQQGLRYRLDVPGNQTHEPLQEELNHRVDADALTALANNAAALLGSGERADFADEARVRGGLLYRTLIPIALRERLRTRRDALLVSSSLHGLPWELLHDGEEFWGLRYALGRRLVTDHPLPVVAECRLPARPRTLVIGADPRGDLPLVSREVTAVCRALAPFADVVAVAGPLATFENVTAHLGRGFDLVHFAGHIVPFANDESALLLANGRPLPSSIVRATLTGRPIVMLNGCSSAAAPPADATARDLPLASMVHAFLFGGAVAAVGTIGDVRDQHAATLAGGFYAELFAEVPIGEALRRARVACRRDPALASSPAWLSFGLYGTPALTLLASTTSAPAVDRHLPGRPPARLSRRVFVGGGLVIAAGAGIALFRTLRPPAPVIVGVMAVGVRTGEVPEWMRTFTRYALIAALREVHSLSIFSQEKIDFLCESRGLCGIAGAESLGMTRMITVSLSRSGEVVALDAEVVDIAQNGLLVGSAHVKGPSGDLIQMQNQLVSRLLDSLGVAVVAAERKRILAARTDDMLDSYRMLMETLPPGTVAATAPQQGGHRDPPTDGSWMAVAYADSGDQEAVRALLRDYEAALAAKDVDALSKLQASIPDEQRAALRRYFDNCTDLVVRLSPPEILVEGEQALATFVREDVFVDAKSGRPVHLKVPISLRLAKDGDRWLIRFR